MEQKQSERDKMLRTLGLFGVIVTDLVAYTGAGVGLGYWLWHKWNLGWAMVPVFSLAGLSLAFYKIYLLSKKEWS